MVSTPGNYERVVEILDGKAPSSYSPDLKIILLKTYAQLGKIFLLSPKYLDVHKYSKTAEINRLVRNYLVKFFYF